MPVNQNAPEPLRKALEDMEGQVQSFKASLAFCAPEMVDEFYIELQQGLAGTMETLYEEASQ
jgi:hypothetical protein